MPDFSLIKNFLFLNQKISFTLSQIKKKQLNLSLLKVIAFTENSSLKASLSTFEINKYKSSTFSIYQRNSHQLPKIYFFMSKQFINLKKVIGKEKEYFPASLNQHKSFSVSYVFYSTNYRIHYFYFTNHET